MGVREGFAVLRLYARDVRVGDEILVGPQGHPIPQAPSVIALDWRTPVCLAATLRDDSGADEVALWLPSSPLTVYRPGGAA